MAGPYATAMKMIALMLLADVLAPASAAPQRHDDQRSAFEQRREGRLLPLREIERRVVPMVKGGQYIGMEFDGTAGIYTLKFLRDGRVIWVEVDGRSGQVIGRSGG
jgi:uncharacterized membrane protein YkoI